MGLVPLLLLVFHPVMARESRGALIFILVTSLCCLPFGVVVIAYSAAARSSYNAGDYEAAQVASDKAENWALAAMLSPVALLLLYLITHNFSA